MKDKRIKVRIWLTAAAVLAVLGALISWYGRKKEEERTLDIVLIQKAMDDTDFWTSMYQGGEMAAAEYNAEIRVLGPEREQEADRQNEMILEAIEEKPDAVVLAPCSSSETLPYARRIEEAGIRLILVDSTMEEEAGEAVISTDNFEIGYKMGEYMRKFVRKDTVIGIVGHVEGSSTALGREAGFRAGLQDEEKCVAEIVFCSSDTEKATELTKELLERHPDMNMIVGLNEYSAVGAARAVKELGLEKEIRMAGIDSSEEEIQLLEEGIFEALVVQKPFNMGYLSVETAVRLVRGEKTEKIQNSGSALITKETMYTEENQKLLFPVDE